MRFPSNESPGIPGAALLAVVWVVGCVSTPSSTEPATGGAPSPPPSEPAPQAANGPTAHPIPRGAGIEDLVALGLEHNPSLRAARSKVARLEARLPQERALPDPMARVTAGSMAETAAGRSELMIGLEQRVPFPGKRAARESIAASEAAAARSDLAAMELMVAERVRATCWDLYLAEQTERLIVESRDALVAVRDSVDARVRTNQAGQEDLLRVSTEIGKIDQQLATARQQQASSKARLNGLLNRPAGASLPSPRAASIPTAGESAGLLAAAEASHPEVRAASARLDAFRHRLDAARLNRLPDFSLGLTYGEIADEGLAMSANGRDQFYGTVGVSLPIWGGALRAARQEAVAGIEESAASLDAARADLRYRIEDAWVRVSTARELTALFDDRLVPEARQAHELALAGYVAGSTSFVDVLDTWRRLLEIELMAATNQAALGKATAALRAAAALDDPKGS